MACGTCGGVVWNEWYYIPTCWERSGSCTKCVSLCVCVYVCVHVCISSCLPSNHQTMHWEFHKVSHTYRSHPQCMTYFCWFKHQQCSFRTNVLSRKRCPGAGTCLTSCQQFNISKSLCKVLWLPQSNSSIDALWEIRLYCTHDFWLLYVPSLEYDLQNSKCIWHDTRLW